MPTLHATIEIIIRTVIIYAFLLVGVRLSGKREIGQLMPFDFVLLLVLSNSVQNAMVGQDSSVAGGLTAAATLLVLTAVLNYLGRHNPRIRRLLIGAPTTIIAHGHLMARNVEREHLTQDDLAQVLREHEVSDMSEVELATLEVDGNLSVIRRQQVDTPGDGVRFVKTRRRLRRQRVSQ
ncbi:MAG: DUF421 domain-containing protein [Candidatus Sumerlaeaceae bacterium]|nr:DUF421 domain-containing protein [Candidatus Sumerlaeaceae bacterium]